MQYVHQDQSAVSLVLFLISWYKLLRNAISNCGDSNERNRLKERIKVNRLAFFAKCQLTTWLRQIDATGMIKVAYRGTEYDGPDWIYYHHGLEIGLLEGLGIIKTGKKVFSRDEEGKDGIFIEVSVLNRVILEEAIKDLPSEQDVELVDPSMAPPASELSVALVR